MEEQIELTIKFKGSNNAFDRVIGRTPHQEQPQQSDSMQAIAQMAALFYQQQQLQQRQIEAIRVQQSAPTTQPQLTPQQLALAYLPPAQTTEFAPPPTTREYATPVSSQPQFAPPPEPRVITVQASQSPPTMPPPPPPAPPPPPTIEQTQQVEQPSKPNAIAKFFVWSLTQPGIVAFYLALIAAAGFAIARHAPIVNHWLSIKQPVPEKSVPKPPKPPQKQP